MSFFFLIGCSKHRWSPEKKINHIAEHVADEIELDEETLYHIVIEHRNHLLVMSDQSIALTDDGRVIYDFRFQDSYSASSASVAQKLLGTNSSGQQVYCMFGANGDQVNSGAADTDINLNDLSFWTNSNNTISTYNIADYNMNGDVNLNDQVIFTLNNGLFTSVPRD